MTIIIKGGNDYDYDSITHLQLAGNPPSGKESHCRFKAKVDYSKAIRQSDNKESLR